MKSEYVLEIQKNEKNKNSIWLNVLAFFVPIWGIFAIFFCLLKTPKRSLGIFKATLCRLFFQILFIFSCKVFFFSIISDYFQIFIG